MVRSMALMVLSVALTVGRSEMVSMTVKDTIREKQKQNGNRHRQL